MLRTNAFSQDFGCLDFFCTTWKEFLLWIEKTISTRTFHGGNARVCQKAWEHNMFPCKIWASQSAPARMSLGKQRWWRAAVVCVHQKSASCMTNKKIRDYGNTIWSPNSRWEAGVCSVRGNNGVHTCQKESEKSLIEDEINGDGSPAGRM